MISKMYKYKIKKIKKIGKMQLNRDRGFENLFYYIFGGDREMQPEEKKEFYLGQCIHPFL